MFADYVVYIKYFYRKSGLFSSNMKAETTICVRAESERGAEQRACYQLKSDLKQKGCSLGNYSAKAKKM